MPCLDCRSFLRTLFEAGLPRSQGAAAPRPVFRRRNFPRAARAMGPDANYLVIPAAAFVPASWPITHMIDSTGIPHDELGGSLAVFRAPVELPAGASVVNVCGFTLDNKRPFSAQVIWAGNRGRGSDALPKLVILGMARPDVAGTPGLRTRLASISRSPTLIRKFQDLDGDGKSHYTPVRGQRLRPSIGTRDSLRRRGHHLAANGQPARRLSATFGDVPRTSRRLPRDRSARRFRHHRRLRQRQLLSQSDGHARGDGGVFCAGARASLAALERSLFSTRRLS